MADVSQMTIREMADFASGIDQALAKLPDAAQLTPAIHQALSAECVQCAIKLTGPDLLKFGSNQTAGDPKLERLAAGYCARNGCDSHYYRIHTAPHPQLDWPKILNPAQQITANAASAEQAAAHHARITKRHKNFLRTATAIGALLLVYICRQMYVGGTIPFIREPENFKVDRHAPVSPR